MPIVFTSDSDKVRSVRPGGLIGEFSVSVTGTTGATRGMAVTTTDVDCDTIDRIDFDPLVNGTTSALVASYSSTSSTVGTVYFWTGTNTGIIPVGSATDLGTHSGLCRVYGTRD